MGPAFEEDRLGCPILESGDVLGHARPSEACLLRYTLRRNVQGMSSQPKMPNALFVRPFHQTSEGPRSDVAPASVSLHPVAKGSAFHKSDCHEPEQAVIRVDDGERPLW